MPSRLWVALSILRAVVTLSFLLPIYFVVRALPPVDMSLLGKLKAMFTHEEEKHDPPSPYPPAVVDWTKWDPAGPADARSPCPMINALCNHHVLPHNGKKITKSMAVNALTKCLNLDAKTAGIFAGYAVTMNPEYPDKKAHWFNLDMLSKHAEIEHDVSLSRNDAAFGDNHSFNHEIWSKVIETYGDDKVTSFESVSKARFGRVKASKAAHEANGLTWNYGLKELILSYGESALFLSLLGDPENGKIPVEYIKVLFEQARVPYKEGWRPVEKTVSQHEIGHLIHSLIHANEENLDEAAMVGHGTVEAVNQAVRAKMPDMCVVM